MTVKRAFSIAMTAKTRLEQYEFVGNNDGRCTSRKRRRSLWKNNFEFGNRNFVGVLKQIFPS